MAKAREDNGPPACGRGELLGKAPPQLRGPKPFVQQYQRGGAGLAGEVEQLERAAGQGQGCGLALLSRSRRRLAAGSAIQLSGGTDQTYICMRKTAHRHGLPESRCHANSGRMPAAGSKQHVWERSVRQEASAIKGFLVHVE